MWGITGFYSKKLTKEKLLLMTNRISHRGPNATGIYLISRETLD